jgi:hypothetical protein
VFKFLLVNSCYILALLQFMSRCKGDMTFTLEYLVLIYVALQIEELRRHIRVILADSGVTDKVLATPFEIAIGSSGTIESIEQMINYTVTTSTDSQVRVGHLVKTNSSEGQISSPSSCVVQ